MNNNVTNIYNSRNFVYTNTSDIHRGESTSIYNSRNFVYTNTLYLTSSIPEPSTIVEILYILTPLEGRRQGDGESTIVEILYILTPSQVKRLYPL